MKSPFHFTILSVLFSFLLSSHPVLAAVVVKVTKNYPATASLSRRGLALLPRAEITETIANNVSDGSYLATVAVGTPPQTVKLVLDTGSSDTWLVAKSADLCVNVADQAEEGGGCVTPCKLR